MPLPAPAAGGAPDLRFERISIEDGLSQSSITALMQDRLGFLWVGTDDGLNRYDGYRFETLRSSPNELNSLSNNRVRSLLARCSRTGRETCGAALRAASIASTRRPGR